MPNSGSTKMVDFETQAMTPTRSPSKRPVTITQGQKQALIDNLQLEITERARKLRAQYALQAQSLRTRIELRVNRIPTAMRKANMGELFEKYLESTRTQQPEPIHKATEPSNQPSPVKSTLSSSKYAESAPPPSHGTKRPSDHISADDDKENTPDPTMPLQSKKRPKPNAHHPANPSAVLSPKSSNSRALAPHQSPIRSQLGSPQKSYLSHPASPLKPSITVPIAPKPASPAKAAAVAAIGTLSTAPTSYAAEKPRATRTRGAAATKSTKAATAAPKLKAPITRAKRGAEPASAARATKEESRNVSAASNTSNATTVVTKPAAKPRAKGGAVAAKGRGKAVGKKAVAANKPTVEAPAQGRRVLRKRG
ncbi:MAG: hypothetical protein Q9223_005400 [Gallowayella weberi]